jgi:hypothetical protein
MRSSVSCLWPLPGSCRHRILFGVIQPRIVELTLTVHFQVSHVCVPEVTVAQAPVQVWLFTPARPKAGGFSVAAGLPSGRNALPSRLSCASNLPGPQLSK